MKIFRNIYGMREYYIYRRVSVNIFHLDYENGKEDSSDALLFFL